MIHLKEDEFAYIVSYIKQRYGVNLEKKKILIECRLKRELEKYKADSFTQYLRMVEADSSNQMSDEMIHRLTTHYTYFFREYEHYAYLQECILPNLSRRNTECYNIWCAGCASGEECYTLAMVLKDYMEKTGSLLRYRILGTDISEPVLAQAQKGIYPAKELEHFPEGWTQKYQTESDGTAWQRKV